MSTRVRDLEKVLERLVDGGVAGRWTVGVEGETVVIHRRGDGDGYATGNRIAEEIDKLVSEVESAMAICAACGEGME